jgi:hypothetical protein
MREPTTLRREDLLEDDHGTAPRPGVGGRRAPDPAPAPAPAPVERPAPTGPLATVVAATGASGDADPDARIWRFGAVGGVLGFAAVAIAVAVPNVVAGQDPGASIGLGLFLGIWGGLGFGGMAGAGIAAARQHARTG